jgi:hypothetical protein
MDKAILKDLFFRYWKYLVIVGLLIVIYFLFNRTQHLEIEVQKGIEKAKEHEKKAEFYFNIYELQMEKDIDLQFKYDSLVIEKNKIYEKIKFVDRYTVSDMQSYFNERTK